MIICFLFCVPLNDAVFNHEKIFVPYLQSIRPLNARIKEEYKLVTLFVRKVTNLFIKAGYDIYYDYKERNFNVHQIVFINLIGR